YLDPRKWAEQSIGVRPVTVVPMTATPPNTLNQQKIVRLEDDDKAVAALSARLAASKPAELRDEKDVAKAAVEAAVEWASSQPTAVGIIVNRVATAKAIYATLRELQAEESEKKRRVTADAMVELVIGSMRPVDRDDQATK